MTNQVIKIDEVQIKDHLGQMVRRSVEETLNGILNAEAERFCKAGRYERSPDRQDTRAGHYTRKLQIKAGEVELQVPKLGTLPFETEIIKRYQRRESSVEEALIEMYLAGVIDGQKLLNTRSRKAGLPAALGSAAMVLNAVPVRFKTTRAQPKKTANPCRGVHPHG